MEKIVPMFMLTSIFDDPSRGSKNILYFPFLSIIIGSANSSEARVAT